MVIQVIGFGFVDVVEVDGVRCAGTAFIRWCCAVLLYACLRHALGTGHDKARLRPQAGIASAAAQAHYTLASSVAPLALGASSLRDFIAFAQHHGCLHLLRATRPAHPLAVIIDDHLIEIGTITTIENPKGEGAEYACGAQPRHRQAQFIAQAING